MSAPVFIHSSFRTSSTWLWEKFRHNDQIVAFYEPFNEILGQISLEEAKTYGNSSWASGHPPLDSYFTEYFLLFKPETKGIENYEIPFAFEKFFPTDENLCPSQIAYIQNLIDHAATRRPLLACTRSLARISPLRKSFGGKHIFLFRNIYDQWNSYVRHYREGNEYFVRTIAWTFASALNSPEICPFMTNYAPKADSGEFCGFGQEQDAFLGFLALHLYLYAKAFSQADLLIDATRLCVDPLYRDRMEYSLRDIFDFGIPLNDAVRISHDIDCVIDPSAVETVIQDIRENFKLTTAEIEFVEMLAL